MITSFPKSRRTRNGRNRSVLTSLLATGKKRKSRTRRSTAHIKTKNYCNPATHEIMSDGACYQKCRRGWTRGPYNRCRLRENMYADHGHGRRSSLIPKNALEKLGIVDKQKLVKMNRQDNRIGVPEAMKVEKIEVGNQTSLVQDPVELDIFYDNVILPVDSVVAIKVRFEVNGVEQIADLHNYYISKRGRRKLHIKTDLGLNMTEMGLTAEATSYNGLFSVTLFMFEKSFVKGIYRMKVEYNASKASWTKRIFSEEKPIVEFMPLFIERPAS